MKINQNDKNRRNKFIASFTLDIKTIERLDEYAAKKSINKSKLVDRLINEEIDKENGKN